MKVKYRRQESQNSSQSKVRQPNNQPRQDRRDERIDSKTINDKMAVAAKNKRLSECESLLQYMKTKNVKPTKHTFCNLINAAVRCGQLPKALQFHDLMLNSVGHCIEASTAYLKGLFSAWECDKARSLFRTIMEKNEVIGERTLDTYLRGCLYSGDIESSLEAFRSSKTSKSTSSFEMVHKTMAIHGVIPDETVGYNASSSSVSHIAAAKAFIANNDFLKADECLRNVSRHELQEIKTDLKFQAHKKNELKRELDFISRFIRLGIHDRNFKSLLPQHLNFSDRDFVVASHSERTGLQLPVAFRKRPQTNLEVCSGTGEWIVEQASKCRDITWIASEIRVDRCFDIILKAFCEGLDNLIVCAGDVRHLFSLIPEQALNNIYVNFPEPPAWHEEFSDSQNDLISSDFIRETVLALRSGGNLQIVSDNSSYMGKVYEKISSEPGFVSEFKTLKATGSSYFDRMFSKGGKTNRYQITAKVNS